MKLFVYEFASSVVWEELPTSIRREGRAMFDAVCADAAASSLVGLDQVIAFESVPPAQERSLLEQAAREADWSLIIAPEFDGLLEQRLGWALEAGGRLLGPGLAAVRLTTDKYVLAQHWQQQGIPTPLTWLDEAAP
ncbi:MAG TPA: hypothetical protein PKD86_17035, partial [Gemmatales bacterium]|nr:hypothetical protein [Gemmatales bacterium]